MCPKYEKKGKEEHTSSKYEKKECKRPQYVRRTKSSSTDKKKGKKKKKGKSYYKKALPCL